MFWQANHKNNLSRCRKFAFFVGVLVFMSRFSKGDESRSNTRQSSSSSRHGLGFLNLGRKNFVTESINKYKNNLILTRIKNAAKLNATCIGKLHILKFVLNVT